MTTTRAFDVTIEDQDGNYEFVSRWSTASQAFFAARKLVEVRPLKVGEAIYVSEPFDDDDYPFGRDDERSAIQIEIMATDNKIDDITFCVPGPTLNGPSKRSKIQRFDATLTHSRLIAPSVAPGK